MINIFNPVFRYTLFHSLRHKPQNVIDDSLVQTLFFIDKATNWFLREPLGTEIGLPSRYDVFVRAIIVPSLFEYALIFGDKEKHQIAIKVIEHFIDELDKYESEDRSELPNALLSAYNYTKEPKYLDIAIKLYERMLDKFSGDRNPKISSLLIDIAYETGLNQFTEYLDKSLKYIIGSQKDNGWFEFGENKEADGTSLMYLGNMINFLIQYYNIFGKAIAVDSAIKCASALLHKFELSGKLLPDKLNHDWKSKDIVANTGSNAYISSCWIDLYRIRGDFRFLNASLKMNDHLKNIQYICPFDEIDGTIPNLYPLWKNCPEFRIDALTLKLYIDSLLREYKIKSELERIIK